MKKKIITKWMTAFLLSAVVLAGCGEMDDEYYDDYEQNSNYDDDYYDDSEDYYDDGDYSDYEGNDSYGDYDDDDYEDDSNYDSSTSGNSGLSGSKYSLGTCGELEGTTLIVSIYLDDKNGSWGSNEASLIDDCHKFVGIATDWISKSAASYGSNAKFVYDWKSNQDLYYEGSANIDMADVDRNGDNIDNTGWRFIEENIDSETLLQKYNANNIAYLFFINTPDSNNSTSCTRNYYEGMSYPYEMCFIYMHCDEEEETPAAVAHEILHTFGAPDLYSADTDGDNYGIPQELVDELERTSSNDIMYTTYDAKSDKPYYDRITNDFTDVDAYYVGLIDSCDFVNKWGLSPSQH